MILQKIILVEVPTEVYPKVFEIFSFLINHSGLPKMSVKKDIDFNKLYDEQVAGKKLPWWNFKKLKIIFF